MIFRQNAKSLRLLGAIAVAGLTVMSTLVSATTSLAQDATIVAAVNGPPVDTNRFWAGGSQWHVMDPILESLVEHDPLTGETDRQRAGGIVGAQ